MRVTRVTAHAFGPLVGETLELTDGLTVIYGPNESAKSTWHAALYAALCGRRRINTGDEREFADRHKPWDRDAWEVSAEVVLADGRRVELRHDLAGRVACYAKDLDLVADYSKEITGLERGEVPDASRWLGLDRRAFLATACVRQSDLLSVTRQAGGIREHLQRAAATAGTDATAAAALAELTRFRTARVGSPQARTKPLQAAEQADRTARQALARAREQQAELQRRLAQTHALRQHADALRVRLLGQQAAQAHAEAARLAGEAERLSRRAVEAAELTTALATPTARDPSAAPIAAALATWESASALPRPGSMSSVDSSRAARRWSLLMLAGGAAAVLVGAYLLIGGSEMVAGGVLAGGVVAAAVGLYLSGRVSARTRLLAVANLSRAEEQRRWQAARDNAWAQVANSAATIGVSTAEPADAVRHLTSWLAAEPERAAQRDRTVASGARLMDLLDGGSLADLRQRAEESSALAARAGASLLTDDVAEQASPADAVRLRREHDEASRLWLRAETELTEFAKAILPVADAEEQAQSATDELTRVQDLDRILALTTTYLTRAQDRVHRDIAPQLAAALRRDLAMVTSDRYTDAVVDPASLRVQVRGPGGRLRDADRLSVGTAEQVYLLLRVALAERLVPPGESCPLLLDDVTVHADRERTENILRLVLGVAQRHQVVLFTQQEQVRDWARACLDGRRDAIRELVPVSTV
jgi:DNA repair exonuclease SbcCD ATPase subunit